jgi:peptidoglycan/LPS O-acetylase OafA/YrhL
MVFELFLGLILVGAIRETARRRGGPAWPFLLAAALGYWFVGAVAHVFLGSGPDGLAAWGWVALCYFSIFVFVGGGRRMKEPWQCPECLGRHPPTTLVCPCGYRPPLQEPPQPA